MAFFYAYIRVWHRLIAHTLLGVFLSSVIHIYRSRMKYLLQFRSEREFPILDGFLGKTHE